MAGKYSREPRHYWLIPGLLMGGEWPLPFLDWLESRGVSMLINLTERAYEDPRFRMYHIPIPDGHPPETEQIERFCRLVRDELMVENKIYAHCHRGCGRTGTLMACYLVYQDRREAEGAIASVRELRYCSIESDAQEDAVIQWASTMREIGYQL